MLAPRTEVRRIRDASDGRATYGERRCGICDIVQSSSVVSGFNNGLSGGVWIGLCEVLPVHMGLYASPPLVRGVNWLGNLLHTSHFTSQGTSQELFYGREGIPRGQSTPALSVVVKSLHSVSET